MTNKNEKQRLLIEYLISSPDTFTLCKSIIKADYFDPEFRKTVAFIHDYYDEYHATPDTDQIFAEVNVRLKKQTVTRDQIAYCSNEIEKFCKRKALEHAILAAPAMISSGDDYGLVEQSIRDAISISLNRQMGLDYFADPRTRLEQMALSPARTSTEWKAFDDLINGGLARTEMLLFSADSGGGKSITLANLAVNFLHQKLNVLYITLELSEELVSQRFDTMFTGIPSVVWRQNANGIASKLEGITHDMGKLVIKHMASGTTANNIRAYLKEFELKYGYVPDLLVIDYIDIMGANGQVSADNIAEKDKQAAEQLRDIGFDYNMFIATASQQGRQAITATELNQSIIAGGMGKVRTVDVYVSIILTPTMKAAGEIGFTFLKTRSSDGAGKTIYMRWDNNSLRILNPDAPNEDTVITDRVAQLQSTGRAKRSLADLLLDT
jgi:replicative DNA helicase